MARLSLPIESQRFLRDWRTPGRLCSVRLQTPSVIRTRQATHSWRRIGKAIARPSSLHHIKLDIIYCNVEFDLGRSGRRFTRGGLTRIGWSACVCAAAATIPPGKFDRD